MNTAAPTFDVGIIGGGPAGASLAAYLARADLKCVVLERKRFPRPHVGESLVSLPQLKMIRPISGINF